MTEHANQWLEDNNTYAINTPNYQTNHSEMLSTCCHFSWVSPSFWFEHKRLQVFEIFSACLCEVIINVARDAPCCGSEAATHLHLHGTDTTMCFCSPSTTLTCYIKISVWYFELKLPIHTLGTSEIYFTSC